MSNIQIETHKDRIINTSVPNLNLGSSNIELAPDDPSAKPRIEIPERLTKPTHDSDSSEEGKADVAEFNFAVNKKKFNPVVKEDVKDDKDDRKDPLDTHSQKSVRIPRDSDSERSRRSSGRRRDEEQKEERRDEGNSDYKPRYSSLFGSREREPSVPPPTLRGDGNGGNSGGSGGVGSFLNSGFFSSSVMFS